MQMSVRRPHASACHCGGVLRGAAAVVGLMVLSLGPASADCKDELVASQQNLQATRAGVARAAAMPEPQRCPAYREHYAAMVKARAVFARCDTGAKRREHAAQLNTSIDGFRKQMPRGCKP